MKFLSFFIRVLCLVLILTLTMACSSAVDTRPGGWWGSRQGKDVISDDDIRRFVAGIRPFIRDPGIHFRQGLYLQAKGHDQAAIEEFRKVLIVDPENIKALNAKGISSDRTGDFERALRSYTKALNLDDELDYVYNNLGYSYFLQGNYTSAIKAFERAVELNPENMIYHNNLGMAYAQKGEFKKALARFERDPGSFSGSSEAGAENKAEFSSDEKRPYTARISLDSYSMVEPGKSTEHTADDSDKKNINDRSTIPVLASREITESNKSEIRTRINRPTPQLIPAEKTDPASILLEPEPVLPEAAPVLPEITQVAETKQAEKFSKTETVHQETRTGFTVQVGAYRYRKNVEVIYFRLFDKGYGVYIDGPVNDDLYRVRVGAFPTLTNARKAAKTLSREEEIETFPTSSRRMIVEAAAKNNNLPFSGNLLQDRKDHDLWKSLEIFNGNGVNNMARRMGNYLEMEGFRVARIANAAHFDHPRTTIYYRPGYDAAADLLAEKIAGEGRLKQVDPLALSSAGLRMVMGRDLVGYEALLDNDPIIEEASIFASR